MNIVDELVHHDCPVCSGTEYSIYLPDTLKGDRPVFGYKWTEEVKRSYRYIRCRTCGHIYASPTHKNIYSFYEDVADEGYKDNSEIRRATSVVVLKHIQKQVPSGSLLDVGCATGDFLSAATKFYAAEGIELSEWALQSSLDKGLTVSNKTIEQLAKTKKKFDVITLWGVIEHLENPNREISLLYSMLNPGGIICIWTGDSNSIFAKVFGKNWWYIMGQHLQLFSRSSLNQLMEANGLELVLEKNYPYVMSAGYLGKRLRVYTLLAPFSFLLSLPLVRKFKFILAMSDQIFSVYKKPV